jgi:DNA-binding transcriptional regulator LsrR (DeoR family)
MKVGKIKTEYFEQPQEVIITADAEGLRYLAEICLRLIDKTGPAAHWHLMERMRSLEAGSIDTRIQFAAENANEEMKLRKIRIEYFGKPEEIIITADAEGLGYLAEICLRLIDKTGPAAHWHLMERMGSLEAGSIDTRIQFVPEIIQTQ